ncbi:hypothetical protein NUSPORA_00140 [Nucleospora cyclopteri]
MDNFQNFIPLKKMAEETTSLLNNLKLNNNSENTLYCKDLSLRTTPAELKATFSDFNVLNIKLTQTPNGQYAFAFITFDSAENAKKALETMNYTILNGKALILVPCNDSNKKYDEGNVFVNNLPENLTTKDLNELFSMFGNVVSCKISTDQNGKSRGYGFVRYSTLKSVKKAILNCENVKLGGNKLVVELYDPKKARRGKPTAQFTNCFVKNFPPTFKEEDLRAFLEKHGKISALYFPLKSDGTAVGFACVNFETPEIAQNAINTLHGKKLFSPKEMGKVDGFGTDPFYIQKSEKKKDRMELLKGTNSAASSHGYKIKRNLYLKNVPEAFSNQEILDMLKGFGEVTDFYMSKDKMATNKKFGFVCYATVEDAAIALERSKQILMDGNQLELTLYKSKCERELNAEDYAERSNIPNSEASEDKKILLKAFNFFLAQAEELKDFWENLKVADSKEFADKMTKSVSGFSINAIEEIISDKEKLKSHIATLISEN